GLGDEGSLSGSEPCLAVLALAASTNARAARDRIGITAAQCGAALPVTPLSQASDKRLETGSFASPPCGGFALYVEGSKALQLQARNMSLCADKGPRVLERLWKTA